MKSQNIAFNAVKAGVALALAIALTACDKAPEVAQPQQPAATTTAQTMPANHPPMPGHQGGAMQQAGAGQLEGGVIKEVMTGGGYTYVKVERAGNEFWAAGPMAELKVGQLIGWQGGAMMKNFHSSSLDRDFAEIAFIGAFVNPTEAALSGGAKKPSLPGGVVEEVMNGGGYTYVRVTQNGKKVWAAGPMVDIKVGDAIAWQGGSLMNNFASKSLDKTFDEIYFVGGFVKPGAAQAAAAGTIGEVKQVIASAGYSYIEVVSDGKDLWLAAPENTLAQGDKISWQGGSVMRNFESRSLERIFEEIVFVDGVTKVN